MTVTTEFGELVWGPAQVPISVASNVVLDDADDGGGASLVVPWSGTITHVGWTLESKAGSPPNYQIGLVVPSISDNSLTATAYGGSAPGSIDPSALSAGFHWTALGTNATATAGDHVGIMIWPTGLPGNPDGSNRIQVYVGHTWSANNSLPISRSGNAPAITPTGKLPAFALKYSDGSVYGWPYLDPAYSAYDSADTPDEVGVKFTVPYAMRCIGAMVRILSMDANASYTVKAYDGADTLLASWDVGDEDTVNSGIGGMAIYWSSPLSLAAETVYRFSLLATNGFSTVRPASGTWPDAATKAAYHQGAAFVATSRSDGGVWTDNANATVFISPIVDQITLPEGGAPAAAGPRWL